MILPLLVVGAGALFLMSKKSGAASLGSTPELPTHIAPDNKWNLPDILPEDQKGVYSREHDEAFAKAALKCSVPFALIKAHALRESALKQEAYRMEPDGRASFGLMQILWWKNSNRFKRWGYDDDYVGDGTPLYEPEINAYIGAEIIKDNLRRFKGNLRDSINAYNTGVGEDEREAPKNYVDNVLKFYSTLVGKEVG